MDAIAGVAMTKRKAPPEPEYEYVPDEYKYNGLGAARAILFAIMVIGGTFLFIYILTLIR